MQLDEPTDPLRRPTIQTYKDSSKELLIKSPQESYKEFDSCLICSDVPTFPVQCVICKTPFCKTCADLWRQKSSRCPKKCGGDWDYVSVKPYMLQLRCPYSEQCQSQITPETFEQHVMSCRFMPVSIEEEVGLKVRYECKCKTRLDLFDGQFQDLMQLPCCQCDVIKLCRSNCNTCGSLFCFECRPPPFTRDFCLKGTHKYKFSKGDQDSVCDVCGVTTFTLDRCTYQDWVCNIAICEVCYEKLPEIKPQKKKRRVSWWG